MAKTLVTGGAGFIGAHVVNHLVEAGQEVVVLDDLSGGFEKNINAKAVFVKGSITDKALVNDIFEKNDFDYVYHLAAYAAEGLSHFIREFNYDNNLIGSIHLINASIKHKVKCFVFTSSIAVYGSQTVPMSETASPQPEDPYGVAKYAVEMDLKTAHDMFGLNYIIFRPHNVYGTMQNIGDRYRNVIGIFMNQLMQGQPLTIFGDGEQTRAFTDIRDVAPHIAQCVQIKEAYNQVFNIGGETIYTINELAKMVMNAMGLQSDIKYLPARNEVMHAFADHSKLHELFKVDPDSLIQLEQGLKEMAAWVMTEGVRKAPKHEFIEISENLPKVWLEDES